MPAARALSIENVKLLCNRMAFKENALSHPVSGWKSNCVLFLILVVVTFTGNAYRQR